MDCLRPAVSLCRSLRPALALLLGAPLATGQHAAWNARGEFHSERFGSALARLPDRDGDGIGELLIGAPEDPLTGVSDHASAYVVSGASLATLLAVTGPDDQEFGSAVAAAGDVDGDGVVDLLVGARLGSSAVVHSGRDGRQLLALAGTPGDWFGDLVAGLDDVDGDGVPDLLVGAPLRRAGTQQVGALEAFSGADGHLLWSVTDTIKGPWLGWSGRVAVMGDLDGDGHAEIATSSPRTLSGRFTWGIALLDGADGSEQWWAAFDASSSSPRNPEQIAPLPDFDGDGVRDLLAAGNDSSFSGPTRLFVLSGVTGAELASFDTLVTGVVYAVGDAGDQDGDGISEWFASIDANWPANRLQVTLHRSSDGATLATVVGAVGEELGRCVATGADLDGDGREDVTLGGPSLVDRALQVGCVESRSWSSGALLQRRVGAAFERSYTGPIAVIGDIDGDGHLDLAAANRSQTRPSVALLSGRDGSLLAEHPMTGVLFGDLEPLPDVDGDATGDYALGVGFGSTAPRVELHSGRDGRLLSTFSTGNVLDEFGRAIEVGIQPSGAVHLAIGAPQSGRGSRLGGSVEVYDAASGALLFRRNGGWFSEALGSAIAFLGDVDGDSVGDWAFGGPGHGGAGVDAGRILVVSGIAGQLIASLPGSAAYENFGSVLEAIDDIDGDGIGELVVGIPALGATDDGGVQVLDGATWSVRASFGGGASNANYGRVLARLADLDGDGADEWVAAAKRPDRAEVRSAADARAMALFPAGGAALSFEWFATTPRWLSGSLDGDRHDDLAVVDVLANPPFGQVTLIAMDDLLLQIEPPSAPAGATVTATLRGGPASAPCGLLLVAISGTPIGSWIALSQFDAAGSLPIADVVPTGLSGLLLEVGGYGIGPDGRLRASPTQSLLLE